MGNKYVNPESLTSASHWPNPTGSQRNREPGVVVIGNTEETEQSIDRWKRHMEDNQDTSLGSHPVTYSFSPCL